MCTSLVLLSGQSWSHWDPFGPSWSHLVPLGPIWSLLVPLGPSWSHLVPLWCTPPPLLPSGHPLLVSAEASLLLPN